MPEIAEVHTIANCINEYYSGKIITNIIYSPKFSNHPDGNKPRKEYPILLKMFETEPMTLLAVKGYGKKILFVMRSEHNKVLLVSSLGMTGFWLFKPKNHTKIEIKFSDNTSIYYDDYRGFGLMDICFSQQDAVKSLSDVGYCLLVNRNMITKEWWNTQFRNKKLHSNKKVVDFLLEQGRFAGIGNYLKSEIMYRAKISPYRTLASLTDDEIETLRQETFATVDEAYKCKGFSLKDYVNPLGNRGTFDSRVYKKKLDSYGNLIEVIGGNSTKDRTTYWVPAVQV